VAQPLWLQSAVRVWAGSGMAQLLLVHGSAIWNAARPSARPKLVF